MTAKYIDKLAIKYKKNPTEKNKKAWYIAINLWAARQKMGVFNGQ